jgi:hypothetical protein
MRYVEDLVMQYWILQANQLPQRRDTQYFMSLTYPLNGQLKTVCIETAPTSQYLCHQSFKSWYMQKKLVPHTGNEGP